MMKVAVLALQGAFVEHERMLRNMGMVCMEIRQEKDVYRDFDAIILPGGESTVMGKLLRDYNLFSILKLLITITSLFCIKGNNISPIFLI